MKCPHDPRETTGAIGMYHCPECGEMVLAGIAHPDYSILDEPIVIEQLQIQFLKRGEPPC